MTRGGLMVGTSRGGGGGDLRGAQWIGRARVRGKHAWQRMALLTVSMLGLQIVWSTEMSQASPYLLSLGLSKSLMAMVFLAGPLSGLIVQPLIGIFADRCKSPLGRRRPFIIGGCLATATALLVFGWTREVASLVATRGSERHGKVTVWLAVISVYVMDFAINVVQAADRALLVDTLPSSQQPLANAWAGRLVGAGAIAGFWLSNIDLTHSFFRFLGDSQLKILSIIACFLFLLAHAVTCVSVEERVLLEDDTEFDEVSRRGMMGAARQIVRVWRSMPRPIRQICDVQFFSWVGWFPILFFSTTWIAEIWFKEHGVSADLAGQDPYMLEAATRSGSRAMLWHAILSFVAAVVLPAFVSTGDSTAYRDRWMPPRSSDSSLMDAIMHVGFRIRLCLPRLPLSWLSMPMLWALSQMLFAGLMFLTMFAGRVWFGTMIVALTGVCWATTMWAPFALLGETILLDGGSTKNLLMPRQAGWRPPLTPITEENTSTLETFVLTPRPPQPVSRPRKHEKRDVVATNPYGVEGGSLPPSVKTSADSLPPNSHRSSVDPPGGHLTPTGYNTSPTVGDVVQVRHSDSLEEEEMGRESLAREMGMQGNGSMDRGNTALEADMDEMDELDEGTADSAGVILGIHNIYVVLPQFFVTFVSAVVFAILAPGKSVLPGKMTPAPTPADAVVSMGENLVRRAGENGEEWDVVGLVFRTGGFASAIAAWLCWRMVRERDGPQPYRTVG